MERASDTNARLPTNYHAQDIPQAAFKRRKQRVFGEAAGLC